MRTFTRDKRKPGASRARRAIAAAIAAAAATVSTTLASPASAATTLAATGARQASGAGERLGGQVAAFVLGHFLNGHGTGRA